MTEYRINTFWSKNDGGYIGTSPEFDGIAVWGQTRQEAVAEAESAIAAYIEIYERDGLPLPKPIPVQEFSGQVRLRMSRYVHQKAAETAEAEGVSLNTYLNGAVEARLAVRDYHQLLLKEISDYWATMAQQYFHNKVIVTAEVLTFREGGRIPMPQLGVGNIGIHVLEKGV